MSFERSSRIADRCVKCGGPLPCALHDRELRRVLLKEENEHEPGFEKAWEGEGVFSGHFVRLSNSIYITTDSVGKGLRAVERVANTGTWRVRELTAPFEGRIDPLALTRDGKILFFSEKENRFALLVFQADDLNNYVIEDVGFQLPDGQSFLNQESFTQLEDGSFLYDQKTNVTSTYHELIRLVPDVPNWRTERLYDVSSGGFVRDEVGIIIRRTNDGRIFIRRMCELNFYQIIPPDQPDVSINWRLTLIGKLNPTQMLSFIPEVMADGALVIIQDDRLMRFETKPELAGSTAPTVIAQEPSLEFMWSIQVVDSNTLISGGEDGVVYVWKRGHDDKWSAELLDSGSMTGNVDRIITEPGNTSEFLAIDIYGSIVFFKRSDDKVRAYHERRAEQPKALQLPANV